DMFNFRVRRVDRLTGIITTIAGTGEPGSAGDGGPATAASLDLPGDIAFDRDGDLFISEFEGQRIRRIDRASNIITTVVGTGEVGANGIGGEGIAPTMGRLNGPRLMTMDSAGNLYIANSGWTPRPWCVDPLVCFTGNHSVLQIRPGKSGKI